MNFCDPSTAALGNITRFNIENAGNNEVVWDITDIHNPKKVLYSIVDEMIYFHFQLILLKHLLFLIIQIIIHQYLIKKYKIKIYME